MSNSPLPSSSYPVSAVAAGGNGGIAPAALPPMLPAQLRMIAGDQAGRSYPLAEPVITIGRGAASQIVISDPQTSRKHLQIVWENNAFHAVDLGSANGFYVNEKRVTRAQLNNGDVITIGLVRLAFELVDAPKPTNVTPAITQSIAPGSLNNSMATVPNLPPVLEEATIERIDLRKRPVSLISRDGGDIILPNPQVSRRHAEITSNGSTFTITDLRSTNGTFVNGYRINTPTPLSDGDFVSLGPFRFMFAAGFLNRAQEDRGVRIDVLNLSRQVTPTLNLLQNISLTILPREFVAVVGGSGAGKTTLMDALSGARPATGGAVLYNKADYYSQAEVYRSSIGYVPQDDIVPTELTVYQALYYAARLRLPSDTPSAELQERIEEVLEDLNLTLRRDTPIHLLSGGQRKRVSIAAELISQPTLFFLDEPTSGLDPGLESRMMDLLRKIADQGRTVILITHATQNVEACDRVIFLARGGFLAFYGTPQEALEYFAVSRFADIYNRLEHELSPAEWASRFQASPYYAPNVLSRLRAVAPEAQRQGVFASPGGANLPPPAVPAVVFQKAQNRVNPFHQFVILTRRYAQILTRDRKNLLILLLQAPIIALMLVLVFNRGSFERVGGNFSSARTIIFLMVIVAVWFGTSNSAREIVKEAAIYRRERRIGLQVLPYIFSKLVVQTGLALLQIAILLGIVYAGLGLGIASPETLLYLYITLVLCALGGVTMGLLISALNTNSDRATSFVPVVLIPQIIFSGAILAIESMGMVGSFISNLMISRWGFGATGRILNLDSLDSARLRFNGPPPDQADQIQALFPGSVFFDKQTLDWYLIPKRNLEFNTDVFVQWAILAIIMGLCLVGVFFFQMRKDRQFTR